MSLGQFRLHIVNFFVNIFLPFDRFCFFFWFALEDRKRCLQSGTDEEAAAAKVDRKAAAAATPHFGESTHIGMTVALLEGVDAGNPKQSITESLMDVLLESVGGGGGGGGATVKGKTPRIDIRLSLNGGSVLAVAPSSSTHVSVVDGKNAPQLYCSKVGRRHRDWLRLTAK